MLASKRNYYGNIRAPEFPADIEWLNTGRPLSLAELRGKLVLLDFWTYGCINCLHIIPDLKALEERYPHELVVIGVHSAKFANEGDRENIRQVVLRYGVEHPVVNDRGFRVWQAFAVRAWPTTILIDPRGGVLASHSGEGVLEAFGDLIDEAIERYREEGILNDAPLGLTTERQHAPETPLRFPGKVLADEATGLLYIADTSHHRIVLADLEGQVLDVIGSGEPGLHDGGFGEARLRNPQGMAIRGEVLYIADTDNHAIRAADLAARTVTTLVGNGELTYRPTRTSLAEAQLNSPWDLELVGGRLYIAMAGLHQIWELDLEGGWIAPFIGSGREGLLDGPLERAALAQPSGLTSDEQVLYFTDPEASAVRVADLDPSGKVRTIIGEGLFEFGDQDGTWPHARLQHALGITLYQGALYVADTYNHKIKRIDPERNTVVTYLGSGEPGWLDGQQAQFYEPGGISGAHNQLFIADTNNHVIRVADLNTEEVRTLVLQDPTARLTPRSPEARGEALHLPPQRVRPGEGRLLTSLKLPTGYHVNDMAPSTIAWAPPADGVLTLPADDSQTTIDEHGAIAPLMVRLEEGSTVLRGELTLYYCQSVRASICLIKLATLEVPIIVTPAAEQEDLDITIPILPEEAQ